MERLLYASGPGWLSTACLLLRRAGRLGYDKQLFLLKQEDVDVVGLTPFYGSMLQAWRVFKAARTLNESPDMWLFEEPLLFNNFLRTQTTQSTRLRARMRMRSNITSVRLINKVVQEVCATLPQNMRVLAES